MRKEIWKLIYNSKYSGSVYITYNRILAVYLKDNFNLTFKALLKQMRYKVITYVVDLYQMGKTLYHNDEEFKHLYLHITNLFQQNDKMIYLKPPPASGEGKEVRNDVVSAICEEFGIKTLNRRLKPIMDIKKIIVKVLKEKYKHTHEQIGALLNNDHSTIVNLYKRVNDELLYDKNLQSKYSVVLELIEKRKLWGSCEDSVSIFQRDLSIKVTHLSNNLHKQHTTNMLNIKTT